MSRTGNRLFELRINEILSPERMSERLAKFAAKRIEEAAASNRLALGRDAPYTVSVDGRHGAPLSSVRPDGVIVAEFDLMGETLAWIGESLRSAAPVRSGQFRDSFLLLADGVEVPKGTEPGFATEYVFVSTMPYARKLERGLSKQSPDGVFDVVATLAARRLGNVASVRFGYRSLHGVTTLDAWASKSTAKKTGRRTMRDAERDDWLRRQPAIIVQSR